LIAEQTNRVADLSTTTDAKVRSFHIASNQSRYNFINLRAQEAMIFRFRVCEDEELSDTAQGWVVAEGEVRARLLIGVNAQLQRMPNIHLKGVPNEFVLLTHGALPTPRISSVHPHKTKGDTDRKGWKGLLAADTPATRVIAEL
jgi:hypothetical protein